MTKKEYLCLSLDPHSRKLEDGIRLINYRDFIRELWLHQIVK